MPFVVADIETLQADKIISEDAAREIESRSRAAMVDLAINAVLCFGILAATGGLIFWLAEPVPVAVVGSLFLTGGLVVLARGRETLRLLGNAAALIGAGMLLGGATIEITDKYPDIAGWTLILGGAIAASIAGVARWRGGFTTAFVQGAILLMGLAIHLLGVFTLLDDAAITGWPKALFYLYCTATVAGAGWLIDVRLITALAIVPFAQVLETGTGYFNAVYVFYSPESTLSISTQVVLIGLLMLWLFHKPERTARHARILALMAFVVTNLCALVGSLWGDVVGETIWGPGYRYYVSGFDDYDAYIAARDAFRDSALTISADVYSILWAVVLAALLFWFARAHQRGLFNATATFAAIHAYTQMFETFGDEPLAFVIGGLGAVILAWVMWQLNKIWAQREKRESMP
ncbi:MAG: hypothetical protein MK098_10880 [Marinovum sp.]|nr:hypothetical protein [Marinovum sp.]